MRGSLFLFGSLALASISSASPGWNFTAPSGEDTAMVINPGSGPSDYGLAIDVQYRGVYAHTLNNGVGILGDDAVGVHGIGSYGFAGVIGEDGGNSGTGVVGQGLIGVGAYGWGTNSLGLSATAGGGDNAIGADASVNTSGYYNPTGVRGTASTDVSYTVVTGVHGIATSIGNNQSAAGVLGEVEGANATEWLYGVQGVVDNGNTEYGIWGRATGGTDAVGVYGDAFSASNSNYAGYFNGDVAVTGYCSCFPSDEKLKQNIRPLDKGLSTVMAMQPKAYDMRVDEYKGKMNLAKGPQIGMIAQDVEKIAPELVSNNTLPKRQFRDKKGKVENIDAISYKSLNYVAMVPILVKAIQEQEAKIESLEKTIQTLSAK